MFGVYTALTRCYSARATTHDTQPVIWPPYPFHLRSRVPLLWTYTHTATRSGHLPARLATGRAPRCIRIFSLTYTAHRSPASATLPTRRSLHAVPAARDRSHTPFALVTTHLSAVDFSVVVLLCCLPTAPPPRFSLLSLSFYAPHATRLLSFSARTCI